MKFSKTIFLLLAVPLLVSSCSLDGYDDLTSDGFNYGSGSGGGSNGGGSSSTDASGSYKMTAFNIDTAQDLNQDGTSNTNLVNESTCLNNNYLTLSPDGTFTADGKTINLTTTTTAPYTSLSCEAEPYSGTWTQNGNQVTLSYLEDGDAYDDVFTYSNNSLKHTETDTFSVAYMAGMYTILPTSVSIIYTKQ